MIHRDIWGTYVLPIIFQGIEQEARTTSEESAGRSCPAREAHLRIAPQFMGQEELCARKNVFQK